MESWRGRGRQAGRDALSRLAAAWKAGSGPGGPGPDGPNGLGRSDGGPNGAGGTGQAREDSADATVSVPERRENTAEHNRVPGWLQTGAAWSWRLLLLAAAIYLIARVLGVLYIVVVPCVAALLLTALLQPLTARLRRAGHAAWLAVVYYMRGTVAVAAIHAVVIGVVLWIMGVPLALPLAVLVFIAAFVPLIGLLVAGALAILVTLAANGWVDAVILLGILIIEDQLEAHLLQPQVVGRVIRLHPLAVILSLAVGAVLAGIPGAVVAVPIVAVITRAVPELRRRDPASGGP